MTKTVSKHQSESLERRATAVNELAFKLLSRLLETNAAHNVFISPSAIGFSLSILLNGANGDTKSALSKILLSDAKSLDSFNHSNQELHSNLEQKTSSAQITLANALWTNKGRSLDPSFSKIVEQFYRAELGSVDLDSAAGVEVINHWVQERTEGRIPSVIEQEDLQPPTSCVVISALHFVGIWTVPFDAAATRKGTFFLTGNKKKSVPMMSQSHSHDYYQNDTVQIIKLAYGESGFSAYFVLPRVPLGDFLTALDATKWDDLISLLETQPVELVLPRFGLTYDVDLSETLRKLGVGILFGSAADFGPMGLSGEFITKFKHKAIATVDEKGTKASAVSAIVMGRSIFSPPQMLINRPFLWAVRHDPSGALLFVAAVFDPS